MLKSVFLSVMLLFSIVGNAQEELSNLMKSADNKMREGNTLGAIKDYTEVVNKYPKYSMGYFGRGSVYAELQLYKDAIADFDQCLLLDSTLADAYYNRAFAYYAQGNNKYALKDYNTYVELKPKDPQGYLSRANVYTVLNQIANARSDLKKYVALPSASAYDYLVKGNVYLSLADSAAAINCFTKSIALEPEMFKSYLSRGETHQAQKNYAKAIEDYNIYLLNVKDGATFIKRAECFAKMTAYFSAIDDYTKALKLMPENPNIYFDRGYYYMEMEQFDKAVLDFDKAIQYGTSDLEGAHYNKAAALFAMGKIDDACQALQFAGEEGKTYKDQYCK